MVTKETSQQFYITTTITLEILGLHIRKGKSYSSTWLGSSKAQSRTSDERVVGSNPKEGICFHAINDYNFLTANRINKLDSLNERYRKALQADEIIITSWSEAYMPPRQLYRLV